MNLLPVGEYEKGQVTIATILIILSAAVVLVTTLGYLTFNEIRKINNVVKSAQSYYAAEAGVEDAILRTKTDMDYLPNYLLTVGGGSTEVDISGPVENLVITSEGNVNSRVRKLAVNLNATPSSVNVSFNYGVQVGDGGLEMAANTEVFGNIFSNGPVEGSSTSYVYGDLYSAGSGGLINNMNVNKSEPTAIDGNAFANTITNSTVENILYCKTESGNNKPCDTSQDDPEKKDMPITAEDITTTKNQAASGGSISSLTVGGGESVSLGPKKINGDLVIESNASLTITGTIWVTGDITLNSNILVKLDSSFGTESGTIIADGEILFDSNVTVCGSEGGIIGSCNAGNESYVMFLSTSSSVDPSNPAIDMGSNTDAAILYTNNGMIQINSNIGILEATAYKLRINSNATVTYESGLADVIFSSGPGGVFNIISWEEIE
jgi:hypothetical protein